MIMMLTILLSIARAGTCDHEFAHVNTLHEHQRDALLNGRDGGFTLRIFTKVVNGLARTVVLAGRGPHDTEAHRAGGHHLRRAFPEIALTRTLGEPAKKVAFPPRPLAAVNRAAAAQSIRRVYTQLAARLRAGTLDLDRAIALVVTEEAVEEGKTPWLFAMNDDDKREVVRLLKGESKLGPPPAEQITFDVEGDYAPSRRLRLSRWAHALARRWAWFAHPATLYLAGAAIGGGGALALSQDAARGGWVAAAGGGLVALHAGVTYLLKRPATLERERRERNDSVARGIDAAFANDADVSELLTLTERYRVPGLSEALTRAGFAEVSASPAK